MQQKFLRILHVLALGIWVGGAGFFNLAVAPTNNRTFKEVVNTAPNERTAGLPLLTPDSTQQDRDRLASALFGAAVGPVFPIYFLMQSLCGAVALVTAISWWGSDPTTRLHRGRVILIAFTLLTVLVGWLISNHVTEIRQLRLSPDPQIAQQAQADFSSWHFVSLGLSLFTILCATVCLTLAALLPPLPTAKTAE